VGLYFRAARDIVWQTNLWGDVMTVLESVRERSPVGYDREVAYLLSVVSAWSYSDEETLRSVLARKNIGGRQPEAVKQFSVQNKSLPVDANGFLISFKREEVHLLAFRGTEPDNMIDLFTDSLIENHYWPAARERNEWVHRGFFLSLDVLWPAIAEALLDLKGVLYITGHSLGGAIALLAGRHLLDDTNGGPRPTLGGVYTYGQPMVGNERFCESCKDLPLYRHVYNRDLVPHLPPTGIGAGKYRHVGALYQTVKENNQLMWSGTGEDHLPHRCHASEILPAFLTLITARTQETSVPLLATSYGLRILGLSLSLSLTNGKELLETISSIPKLLTTGKLSMDDHIPTHYVDVSKSSVPGKLSESFRE
jgi:triacylglycerol lipase